MDLRLFPLQTVLFPGMRLPIHVFEERYRLMIRECIEEDAPFGVLLIKSGSEAGPPAVPHDVGTTARILQVEYLEDGRMNIFTVGERRFRTIALNTTQPYLRGEVAYVDQRPPSDGSRALVARTEPVFGEYFRTFLAIGDQWSNSVPLPSDPAEAADFVAVHQYNLIFNKHVIGLAKPGATLLLNAPYGPDEVWDQLPASVQQAIVDKGIDLWVIDAFAVAVNKVLPGSADVRRGDYHIVLRKP